MGVLVDDLLLLARLDQQRPLDAAAGRPASTLATDAVQDARALAPDRAVELRVDAGGRPPSCSATRCGCARCWATCRATR